MDRPAHCPGHADPHVAISHTQETEGAVSDQARAEGHDPGGQWRFLGRSFYTYASRLRVSENMREPACVRCCVCLFIRSSLGPALEDSGSSDMAGMGSQNKLFF